jgi:hypothetical protein
VEGETSREPGAGPIEEPENGVLEHPQGVFLCCLSSLPQEHGRDEQGSRAFIRERPWERINGKTKKKKIHRDIAGLVPRYQRKEKEREKGGRLRKNDDVLAAGDGRDGRILLFNVGTRGRW